MAFFLIALIVLALDQVSKFLIRANMSPGQSIPEDGLFRITYVTNIGGVFGILSNQAFLILLTTAVGIAAILLYSRYPIFNRMLVKISLGLLLGGALGNLIDRLSFGWVVDFIDLGFWPVFNLADSAIVLGVTLLFYYFIFLVRKEERLKENE
ncbi:MAG: signal peptidase II [Dehalococcoidia bacterium]|nr:MAG: signal peptidase II [Dehalococcoidia bacterium]